MVIKKAYIIFSLVTFIGGILAGIAIDKYFFIDKTPQFKIKSVREKGFSYTSPLLYTDTSQENSIFVKQLSDNLNSAITTMTQEGLAKNISVYVRFPFLSDWTVINGSEKYSPASLLKVPVMMVYLRNSESNPSLLSTTLTYDIPDDNENMNYEAQQEMEKGKSYTIDELIRRMIVYSDNNAEQMLTKNINQQEFNQIFDDLQINRLNYAQQENSMNVQTYSYFFRVLYNSTFLDRQISEKALKLLSQTTFTQGIVAGVPKNVIAAHKFGERNFQDTGVKQLHDCGIVYYTQNPYLLCVMTRGNSFKNLEGVIKKVSEVTYSYTKQQNENDLTKN